MIWDASDANPMHRRIPAEIVSRRKLPHQRPGFKPEEVIEEVTVDVKSAIILKPEARVKWLSKACAMVERGTASSTELYDVVTNRKFSGGLPARVGRKLATALRETMTIFSDKQQRYLMSVESPLGIHFTLRPDMDDAADEEEEAPVVATATAVPSGIPVKEVSAARSQPPAGGQDLGSSWQVAEDDATKRRLQALEEADKLQAKTKKKEEKKLSESDKAKKAGKEVEQKQKQLEEEADNLLGALVPGLGMAPSAPPIFSSKPDRGRSVSASRSRSISSRAARRHQRDQKRKKEERANSARKGRSESGVSGSRALLMNKNYQDDLPHLPRHAASASNNATALRDADRSESRSRSRRRRRR